MKTCWLTLYHTLCGRQLLIIRRHFSKEFYTLYTINIGFYFSTIITLTVSQAISTQDGAAIAAQAARADCYAQAGRIGSLPYPTFKHTCHFCNCYRYLSPIRTSVCRDLATVFIHIWLSQWIMTLTNIMYIELEERRPELFNSNKSI